MAVEIPLTQGKAVLVDEADHEWLSRWKWYYIGNKRGRGYAARGQHQPGGRIKTIRMHRVIMGAVEGEHVDHINGDTLDNRRCNLRRASIEENSRNRRASPRSTSRYKGVSWNAKLGKWRAQIRYSKKNHGLGDYDLEEDAARAHDDAARKYHGKFARLNFPQEGEQAA